MVTGTQVEEYEALVEACAKAAGGEWPTARARAVIAVIAEKAAEWPTEDQENAARDWSLKKYGKAIGNDAAHGCWRAMFAASPLVKPKEKATR